ncbi:dUTP diphosphatase [Anoxybacillus sp. J5B_2022]|uniref:dUTP diphosphatase n=1 Tax=Anoxybacillus sp. J5B_2022 TaxID=3003246 RepID=UPI0022856764|nr:dUTP diphosphatase [Anoxybacillus sp. J5B_2022]MCZ0754332.1 dUTP diphosphatase [Anoxybacillus sp. J5B_2022]
MDLSKLFEMQRELDERIVREKGLEGQSLLPNKILALQVELGELANEWRGFKYWSKNQQPRLWAYRKCPCGGEWCDEYGCQDGGLLAYNPLLEEYVDALHFALSIGLEIKHDVTQYNYYSWDKYVSITELISTLIKTCYVIGEELHHDLQTQIQMYILFLCRFITLGEKLGFTWEQVEEAYMKKNAVNHHRQESGY